MLDGFIYNYRTLYVLEIAWFEAFLCFRLPQRQNFQTRFVILFPLGLILGIFLPLNFMPAVLVSVVLFIMTIFIVWQLYELSLFGVIFLCISAYMLQNTVVCCVKILLVMLRLPLSYTLLMDVIIIIPVSFIFYMTFGHQKSFYSILTSGKAHDYLFLATSITSASIIITMNTLFGENGLDTDIFCRIGLIFTNCFAITLQYYLLKCSSLEMDKSIINHLLQAERQQYHIACENMEIINMKCHDLKHQIAAIRSASAENNDQNQALQEAEEAVMIYNNISKTGHRTLDSVLTQKMLFCEKYHINMSYMVDADALSVMDDMDIYILFGNAIDNAIENVMKEQDDSRIITLQVFSKNGFLTIHLENYCTQPPSFFDGLPQTTKHDKSNHGFGVKSIRYLVQSYQGHVTFKADDDFFSLDILIPDNPKLDTTSHCAKVPQEGVI